MSTSSPSAKSRWGRMGTVVRRASSVMAATRPATPSIASSERDPDTGSIKAKKDNESIKAKRSKESMKGKDSQSIKHKRSSDSASLKQISTAPANLSPPSTQHSTVPSPIAESPAREAAASLEDHAPIGPSPLAQGTVVSDIASPTSAGGYTPPPLLDSSAAAGPGAFTDEPDDLPQPVVAIDPARSHPPSIYERESASHATEEQPPTTQVESPEPEPQAPAPQVEVPAPQVEAPAPQTEPPAARAATPEPQVAAPVPQVEAPAPQVDVPAPQPEAPAARAATPEPQVAAPVPQAEAPVPQVIAPIPHVEAPPPQPDAQPEPPVARAATPVAVDVVEEPKSVPKAESVELHTTTIERTVPVGSSTPVPTVPNTPNEPAVLPQAKNTSTPSYFDLPVSQAETFPESLPPAPETKPADQDDANRNAGGLLGAAIVVPVVAAGAAAAYYNSMPEPVHEQADKSAPVAPQVESAAPPSMPMPTYDIHSGHQVWGGPVSLPQTPERRPREVDMPSTPSNGDANGRSRTPSIHRPLEDPFADPIAPRIVLSHSDEPHLPNPHISGPYQQAPVAFLDEAQGNIVMPVPVGIGHPRSIQEAASTRSSGPPYGFDTDETRPLISRGGSPKNVSYLLSPANPNHVTVSPSAGPSFAWNDQPSSTAPRLHNLGWIEYLLPDGYLYYVHPTLRAITDVDLRHGKLLDAVMVYFENHKHEHQAPAGVEAWLRDAGSSKRGFVPVRCWVDHKKRSVTLDRVHEANGNGHHHHHRARHGSEDDSLDIEYRYWSFVEAHPAHTTLPLNARAEAMDVLTWAWTDRLLPSNRSAPAPFTQDECQELITLLRSFESSGDAAAQTVVHTRIVSRILLRVAQWRQTYFRPEKALPTDVGRGALRLPEHRRPFRKTVVDLLISCLCLGIPYIFFSRNNHPRIDEEGGVRSAAPMLVIGACTCLVAAIVLSASVTLLSLPGLDNFARVAGIVAILFASFSMVSTVVAVFRCKADMGRAVPQVGGEGLLMLSRRSIILSLPLVFLAYSITGFVTGIVLYSFRGVTTATPLSVQQPFTGYTGWAAIGVLGGLGGILATALFSLRR